MLRESVRQRVHPLAFVVATLALILAAYAPTAAVVRFEPTPEPVPERWGAEVDVSVAWAGVSMRVPAAWKVSVKDEPATGFASGASLLAASGPGDTMCMLHVYDPQKIDTWQDAGVAAADELTIAGYRTERFDDMWGTGSGISSAYSIHAGERLYSLLCSAERAPADRWLSIAETISLNG